MSISFSFPLPNKNSVMNQPVGVDVLNLGAQSPSARDPLALDVLYITSSEDFLDDISKNLKYKAEKLNVPMEILYVEQIKGRDKKEKISDLENQIRYFHENGKIDEKTQIIILVHGSISEGPHELSNKKNDFSISTVEIVDLIRKSKMSDKTNVKSDAWEGTIHIGACGSGRAGPDLKENSGMNLLYAGKNMKLGIDSEAIFSEFIGMLGECRKDAHKNLFPTTQQFYDAAGKISGEKISLSGRGNLCHIRSTYLPLPTDLVRQDVVDKLEKSLTAKLIHGKASTVKKITELLGRLLQNIKFCDPLLTLVHFCGNDFEEKLKILIEAGVDINKRFYNEATALHHAVENGKKKEALLLIKYGANIEAKNKFGETPLSTAIRSGDVEMLGCLMSAGADIGVFDRDGNSALHVACQKNNKDLIERLLEKGASAFAENYAERSALQNLMSAKRSDIVDLILAKSPQSNFSEMESYDKALFSAISENAPQIFRTLIQGIPNKQNALSSVFKLLIKEITENNEINQFDSILFGQHKVAMNILVRFMLESNDSMPDYFQDYLMSFLGVRYEEYLPVILAIPNLGEKWSSDLEMLRDVFADMGRTEVSDLFGAAITLKSKLSERIDRDLFQLFQVDEGGLTPFQRACRSGNIAELIILDQVTPNFKFSKTSDGKSALMLACEANSVEVVNWLLDKGSDRDSRDGLGKTVLDYAIETGNAEIEHAIRTRFGFAS